MHFHHRSEIDKSVDGTVIFDKNVVVISTRKDNMEVTYSAEDTVSAILRLSEENEGKRICALNFASYKNPGGKFLDGSSAQEESLCHESTLYNVLENFQEEFYKPNAKRLHNSLYDDNLIYSPDIFFIRDKVSAYADIITCAAPNRTAAKKYRGVPDDVITDAMVSRIDHVLNAAYAKKVDILILGAFGCGVFGNDPVEVSRIFNLFLSEKYDGCFEKVVFAVPSMRRGDATPGIFKATGLHISHVIRCGKFENLDPDEIVIRNSVSKYINKQRGE
jgi:uncharacterized protein (TIGR02452 family)